MDTMTLLVMLLLFMIALQMGEAWMLIGLILLTLFLTRDIKSIVLLGLAGFVLWVIMNGQMTQYLPFVLGALILIAVGIGIKPAEEQPDTYSPDMGGLEGLMGGGGGDYGGFGGL